MEEDFKVGRGKYSPSLCEEELLFHLGRFLSAIVSHVLSKFSTSSARK